MIVQIRIPREDAVLLKALFERAKNRRMDEAESREYHRIISHLTHEAIIQTLAEIGDSE